MKLSCQKCNKELTSDLYPVKMEYSYCGYYKKSKKIFQEPYRYFQNETFKKGIFFITKEEPAQSWTDLDIWGEEQDIPEEEKGYHSVIPRKLPEIVVGMQSILEGVIPVEVGTVGCCNWFNTPLVCRCGQKLGTMNLDCMEFGGIYFDIKKVRRVYKK